MAPQRLRALAAAFLLGGLSIAQGVAAPLIPGNILVSGRSSLTLTEYTVSGAAVQTFSVPPPPQDAALRDIIVDGTGNVHIFNGTFTPMLTSLNVVTGGMTHQSMVGWSTVNNISFGGIGVVGNFVYVTDTFTFNGGEPMGIIRFDLTGGAPLRFAEFSGYQDLTIGGNSLLYALPSNLSAGRIDVFDPVSLNFVRSISLGSALLNADIRGIAVGFDGSIYAAGWNGTVYAIDVQGNITNSLSFGVGSLLDIDVDASGRLVISSRFGHVIVTDTALSAHSIFTIPGGESVHVAWTRPIPEPRGILLFGLAVGLGFLVRLRQRGATKSQLGSFPTHDPYRVPAVSMISRRETEPTLNNVGKLRSS